MNIRYFSFGRYHGKQETQGSTFIRMQQMEKYWDIKPYKYGENPDVLIFQKVYCTEDYKFPAHFEGIKILDICDPDWLNGSSVVETCKAMDAVTCPTEPIAEFIRQFHDNVHVVPDRFDLIVEPKVPRGKAKTVAWFGYSHNAELMKPAMKILDELNLNLILIANDNPFVHQWSNRDHKEFYTFVKYDEDKFYDELKKADFCVLPYGQRPVDIFKSNNKDVKSMLAGLPVAKNVEDVKKYMSEKERRLWFDTEYDKVKKDYDISKSVSQYKDIINELKEKA